MYFKTPSIAILLLSSSKNRSIDSLAIGPLALGHALAGDKDVNNAQTLYRIKLLLLIPLSIFIPDITQVNNLAKRT